MLSWEQDVEAHALRRQGWSISAIARHVGVDRKTVRAYLNGERTPGVRAPAGPDQFGPFVEYCRLRLGEAQPLTSFDLEADVSTRRNCDRHPGLQHRARTAHANKLPQSCVALVRQK